MQCVRASIAMSVDKLKIVELHEGENLTKKVWRFNVVEHYTKSKLEHEIEGLFPHITKKGLKLNLYHYDELALTAMQMQQKH